jgi:hypothetical protein
MELPALPHMSKPELLNGELKFAEKPAWDAAGNAYFRDAFYKCDYFS